ncbi:T6SS effector BTH_I2691 family protein, partial [Pseudomonas sp. R5(2019)]|uniref:T6SS effector BTH_I2691 family protein n=1 Tax=Pseudomonas sp. R5(2019) TaxID=2697566 RepID=UPI00273DBB75
MNTRQCIGIAMREACPNPPGSCNACERTGLPILPLRAAYAPSPGATQKQRHSYTSDLESIPMRPDQPRTLRHGFLYVLLDKQEWQAYQVTPEGALRQFSPFQMPLAMPASLSQACIKQDHDVTASFINIDTARYRTAWLAFANDAWPAEVLNRYQRAIAQGGTVLDARFHPLDLSAARNDPASVGLAMTEHALQVDRLVLEYAAPTVGDFVSVHGFHSRNHRLKALRGQVRTLIQREQLPQGMLAIVLPDPIGLVQEYNAQRVSGVE